MYIHVPSAWLAYLAFFITAAASALFLWTRTRSEVWDRVAGASAELGVMFTGLALVLGSIWGRPVWGFWWAWDARLVSTALLFFLFLGYCALRRIPAADPVGAAKRNAIAALIAFVDVPIVHFSVEWWRTLHQKATVFNPELNPQIHGVMGLTLWLGTIAFRDLPDSFLPDYYDSIDRVLALDWDRWIPGHPGPGGRLGTKDDVRFNKEYLTDVSNAAKELADKGRGLNDDAMRAVMLPKYEGLVCAGGR
jgi:hypothetical protein